MPAGHPSEYQLKFVKVAEDYYYAPCVPGFTDIHVAADGASEKRKADATGFKWKNDRLPLPKDAAVVRTEVKSQHRSPKPNRRSPDVDSDHPTAVRSANWPATHERTARAGGALFPPRVRPARRRADPVARRAPARPRRGCRSSRARGRRWKPGLGAACGRPGRLRTSRCRWHRPR